MAAMDIAQGHLLGLSDYDTFCAAYHSVESVYNNPNHTRSD
ncbi:10733_t:CDS:1, partial [Cetraspora pellucida]